MPLYLLRKKVFNNYYLAIKRPAIGKYISDFSLGSFDSVSSEDEIVATLQDINARLQDILAQMRKKRKANTDLTEEDRAKITELYNNIVSMKENIISFINRDTRQSTLF